MPFVASWGFDEHELNVILKGIDLVAAAPITMLPARARVRDVLGSGDNRLEPIVELASGMKEIDDDPISTYTRRRLGLVRSAANERGSASGVVYASIGGGVGVVLDGLHRVVVAYERDQEFLYGFVIVTH